MREKILGAIVTLLLTSSCATMDAKSVREEGSGKSAPVIRQIHASPHLNPGDVWKIYIKAADVDGDMKTIIATIGMGESPGPGFYISFTRLQPEYQKEISGYLFWWSGKNAFEYPKVVLTLQIQDGGRNLSNPVSIPLQFKFGTRQESPVQGEFQEKEIGPIMIVLEPLSRGGE